MWLFNFIRIFCFKLEDILSFLQVCPLHIVNGWCKNCKEWPWISGIAKYVKAYECLQVGSGVLLFCPTHPALLHPWNTQMHDGRTCGCHQEMLHSAALFLNRCLSRLHCREMWRNCSFTCLIVIMIRRDKFVLCAQHKSNMTKSQKKD